VKQRELEMKLQQLKGFQNPKARLEQYATPAKIAAYILYTAHGLGDVQEKRVMDLGCGTGVFSIGACMLGAKEVTGIDIDQDVITIAIENANNARCHVNYDCLAVEKTAGEWDTCIMNPPFGSQTKHADLPFLDKALEISKVIYSLHNSETVPFLRKRIENTAFVHGNESRAGHVLNLEKKYNFQIPHTFKFHTKEKLNIEVTLLRIEKT